MLQKLLRMILEGGGGAGSIFNSFWFGSQLLPSTAIACLNSFISKGHIVHLYCYEPILNAPRSVVLNDANLIMSRSELTGFEFAAQAADFFRYNLIYKVGGWWIDCDVICMSEEIPTSEFVFAWQEKNSINNGQFKFPRGHAALGLAVKHCKSTDRKGIRYAEFGPELITKILTDLKMDGLCHPTTDLFPIHWLESFKFLLPEFANEVTDRTKSSPFIHLFTAMFSKFGFDERFHSPPSGCFLDIVYLENGVDRRELKEIDPDALRQSIALYLSQPWVQETKKNNQLVW
jgi:hypothetical protein